MMRTTGMITAILSIEEAIMLWELEDKHWAQKLIDGYLLYCRTNNPSSIPPFYRPQPKSNNPHQNQPPQLRLAMARARLISGEPQKGMNFIKACSSHDREHFADEIIAVKMWAWLKQNQPLEAEMFYQSCVNNPSADANNKAYYFTDVKKQPRTDRAVMDMYLALDKFKEAKIAIKGLKSNGQTAIASLYGARIARLEGRHNEVKSFALEAHQYRAQLPFAEDHFALCQLLIEYGQFSAASSYIVKLKENNPNNPEVERWHKEYCASCDAQLLYTKLDSIIPATQNKGEKFSTFLAECDTLATKYPDSINAQLLTANAYFKMGLVNSAIEVFEALSDSIKQAPQAQRLFGQFTRQQTQQQKVIEAALVPLFKKISLESTKATQTASPTTETPVNPKNVSRRRRKKPCIK